MLLDREHLTRFRDRPNELRTLVNAFLITTEPILEALEQARRARDQPAFHNLLHALAGAAALTLAGCAFA
jgi:HPt (histidine-containing phosphotransfer) domain-containing protein